MKNKDRIKYPFSIRKMLTKLKLTQNEKQIVSNRFVSMNRPLNKDIRDVRKQKRTRNNNNIQRNAKIPKLNLRGVKRTRNNTNKSNNKKVQGSESQRRLGTFKGLKSEGLPKEALFLKDTCTKAMVTDRDGKRTSKPTA